MVYGVPDLVAPLQPSKAAMHEINSKAQQMVIVRQRIIVSLLFD
jgi:hypothetical protein